MIQKIYRLELWRPHQIHNAESPSLWIRMDFTNEKHYAIKIDPPFGAREIADALEQLTLRLRDDSFLQGNAQGSIQPESGSDPRS